MFRRLMLTLTLMLSAFPGPQIQGPRIAPEFGQLRNQRTRGGASPVHPKPGTRPAKHCGHAKHRGGRAARRRARLARRG